MATRGEQPPQNPDDNDKTAHIADLQRERSYRFEKSDVDPDRFYVRSRDDSGHSEWMRIRVPPRLYDQVAEYVGKRSRVGWRSFNDAVRDALVHRVSYVARRYGDDDQQTSFQLYLAELDFLEEMAIEEEARRWVQQACEQLDSIVSEYSRRRQPDIALEKLEHWLQKLPGHEEAHHVYVAGYIRSKMAELRKDVAGQ